MKTKFYPKHAATIYTKMFAMICIVLAVIWTTKLKAQLVSTYTFSQSTTTYTPISGGTVITQYPNFDDDNNWPPVSLGFNFIYHGTSFTIIGMSDDGNAVFGHTPSTGYSSNPLISVANSLMAVRNDLLGNATTHQLRYQTTGSTGNHVFTLEWYNWGNYSSGNAELNFQIKLYEASGAVQFVYQPVTPSSSADYFGGYLVGLTGDTVSDFQDRNGSDWTTTTSGTTPATDHVVYNITTYPPNGLTFTWTPPACSSHFTVHPDTIPHNWLTVNQASGIPPLSYLWHWGDGDSSTGANPSHIYNTPGYYNICLTVADSVGCTSTYCDSSTYLYRPDNNTMITINGASQITHIEEPNHNSLIIYPNPLTSSSILQFNTQVNNAEVIIYDMVGKVMMRKKLTGDRMTIEKGSLESGIYFVRVNDGEKQWIEKMVVE